MPKPCMLLTWGALPALSSNAAKSAEGARAAFERGAEKHGFTFTYLPKLVGDMASKEQLRNAGARAVGCTRVQAAAAGSGVTFAGARLCGQPGWVWCSLPVLCCHHL